MRRLTERARTLKASNVLVWCVVVASAGALCGCDQLDARNRTRRGNRLFRETHFVDAAAEYHRALKDLDDPIVHYNLGLAYSKIFKPGYQAPVLLGTANEFVCQQIPGVKMVEAGACVKEGDRHYAECGSKKMAEIQKQLEDLDTQIKAAADETKKKELEIERKDKQDELLRFTCPSSFQCVEGSFCSLTSPEIADLAGQHFQIWIKAQESDDEIKKHLVDAQRRLEEAKKVNNQSEISTVTREIEELQTKSLTRILMTRLWMDSEQHNKALEYWRGLLKEKPTDTEIIRTLAGIQLSAGDWRGAIDGYNQVADLVSDPSGKAAEYQYIGNLAWSKLNSKQLIGVDAIELADRGIAALQRASELQPKVSRWPSLQASIFNFRSTAHGASWAAAIDRATAQDLSKLQRVLAEEAKNAQGQAPSAPGGAAPTAPAPASGSGEAGAGSGSSAGGAPSGGTAPAAAPGSTESTGSGAPAAPPATTPAPATPTTPATGGTVEKSGG